MRLKLQFPSHKHPDRPSLKRDRNVARIPLKSYIGEEMDDKAGSGVGTGTALNRRSC